MTSAILQLPQLATPHTISIDRNPLSALHAGHRGSSALGHNPQRHDGRTRAINVDPPAPTVWAVQV